MARARNIKPALFTNDTLAEIEPLGRLLFIGLWTIANYKGDLIWRPKRVKAQILPYDECSIEELAINLDKSGFVRFYSDGNQKYLRIVNFGKHQNPHKNEREKGSEIPEYTEELRQLVDFKELAINLDKSGLNRNGSTTNPADSLNLIPETLNQNPEGTAAKPPKQTRKRFVEPTLEEVRNYFIERGETKSSLEPQKFHDFYSSKGWVVGKQKMKDWKAAVRGWISRNQTQGMPTQQQANLGVDDTSWIDEMNDMY